MVCFNLCSMEDSSVSFGEKKWKLWLKVIKQNLKDWKQIFISLTSRSHSKKEGKVEKNLKYIHFLFLPTCYTVLQLAFLSLTHYHSYSHSYFPPINSLKAPWKERPISISLCIFVKWLRFNVQHTGIQTAYSPEGKTCLKCWRLDHRQHLRIHETWFFCFWCCLGTGDLEFSLS